MQRPEAELVPRVESTRPAAPQPDWIAVRRRGEVTAAPAAEGWTWMNEGGELMRAQAGDWRVTGDHDRSWSVAADIFGHTYEQVSGDRYRRVGVAHARPAVAGEVVESLEGQQTARQGDWVIRGSKGEQWLTSDAHFTATYEQVPTPS